MNVRIDGMLFLDAESALQAILDAAIDEAKEETAEPKDERIEELETKLAEAQTELAEAQKRIAELEAQVNP